MADFVLVHGAWHGAWCWRRVVDLLSAHRHRVHAVTLTGTGERSHLMSPLITLETHIADVANTQRTVPPDHELLAMARDIGVCLGE